MTNNNYDVLIIGGGMVGASMAAALSPLKLKVGLVDAFAFNTKEVQPAYDDRSIALSYGSSLIYQGIGIWKQIEQASAPIDHIHVSDKGHLGVTRLHANREKVPALGYVIESRVLGKALYSHLLASQVKLIAPAKLIKFEQGDTYNDVVIDKEGKQQELRCKLLIASDGAQSFVRKQLGIPSQQYDYQQSAIIANVSTDQAHNNWAYERFTDNGPLALLPLPSQDGQQRLSLVWTHKTPTVESTMALSDQDFLAKLQDRFGYRLGKFIKAGKRSCYPLHLLKSEQDIAKRSVLIGNASHLLHPVAGQGLNLGLRDVAVLADLLAKAVDSGADYGDKELLQSYQKSRKPDYDSVISYTDTLVHLFSNDFPPLAHLRAGGLLVVDRIPSLRKLLAQRSMGLKHRQSRLARGIPLS